MRTDSIIFRKIVARIALLGLTRRQVADQLMVSYGTLHNKLCGITPFTLDEAIALKNLLNIPGSLEDAFEKVDPRKVPWQ